MPATYHKKNTQVENTRAFWWILLAVIISLGLLSRMVPIGFRLYDKYLGDTLYAAMFYILFRLTGRITHIATWTAITMTALELFQLTGIPANMIRSGNPIVRTCARLLGTEFSFLDLLAYAVGIGCVAAISHMKSRVCG